MEVLSRLIMTFRDLKRSVLTTSGAPNGGSRHSAVDDEKDVRKILTLLVKESVMWIKPGRTTCGPAAAQSLIVESIDSWTRVCFPRRSD